MRRATWIALALVIFTSGGLASPVRAADGTPYVVQSGDTWTGIAARYGRSPDELARHNGMVNPALVEAGLTIWLPPGSEPVFRRDGPATVVIHVVQRGETVHHVALQYGITVEDLLWANHLDEARRVKAGQVLTIVLFGARAGDANAAFLPTVYHTLQQDESLLHAALHHNVRLIAVTLYNGLWHAATPPGTRLAIPPAALLVASTGQEVAGVPSPSPSPSATPTAQPPTPTLPPPPPPTPTDPATPQTSPTAALQPAPVSASTPTPAPPPPGNTPQPGLIVTFGDPVLIEDGRAAMIDITLTNISISPAIEGGRHYFQPNPGGGLQWVTLLGVAHEELPIALADEAPLWRATVTMTDGSVWPFYAGCTYLEEINHTGYEPTGPDSGFVWEVHWTGGFFDCGNGYKVKPEDMPPGATATVPLTVYLQHPRQWGIEPPPTRRIARIDLALWRSDGLWLGDVASVTYP